jgi:hypothetical protein
VAGYRAQQQARHIPLAWSRRSRGRIQRALLFNSVQDGCRVLAFIVRARIFPDQSDEVLVPPRHHLVRFAPSKPHTILRLERDPLERCAIHQVFLAMNGSTASACSLGHSASKADSGSSATFTLSIHEAILAARNFAVL